MVKILVVDDEKEICDTLQRFLNRRGYEVVTAYNGVDAISKVKLERPHIVLLDIVMPDINGIEVLKRIKEIDKETGVIMVTAVEDLDTARTCIKSGAYDYITKPFDPDYLEKSLLAKLVNMLG